MSLNGPAAARLFDEHVDAVYSYVVRRVGAEPAPVVVADVFEQALRTHDQYTERAVAPKGGERSWLLAIATALLRRHAATEHRRLQDWQTTAGPPTARSATADPLLTGHDSLAAFEHVVMSAVGDLDPADRDFLLLMAWERCTPTIAAEVAGVPLSAAKARLNAIRGELKRAAVESVSPDGGRVPNPLNVVESSRPAVSAMPDTPRRHNRERLFEIATATRSDARSIVTVDPSNVSSWRSNLIRLGTLAALGIVAVGGLALASGRADDAATGDTVETPDSLDVLDPVLPAPLATITIPAPPTPTIASTTTTPPVPGSPETPLLVPPERSRLESLVVTRGDLGGTTILFRAPDQSTVALREVDGVAPVPAPPVTDPDTEETIPTVPSRPVGGLSVTGPLGPGRYDVAVQCGALQVTDAPDRLPFRPAIEELLGAISIAEGTIDINVPPGWTVIGQSPSVDGFQFGVPVDVGGRSVVVTVTQYPGGGIALAGFGGKQYSPTTFLGQPAWVSRQPDDPARYEVVGQLRDTAFAVATNDISLAELESVINSFDATNVDDWVSRFGALPTRSDPDIRRCPEQPEFVVS